MFRLSQVACGPSRPSWVQRHPLLLQQQRRRVPALLAAASDSYGGGERVLDLTQLLQECDDLDGPLEDHEEDLPVWEHEHRVKAVPFTQEELQERERFLSQQQQLPQEQHLQQDGPDLLPDPLQAISEIASAYSAEQGFREMSVQELSVALTAGGLIDLVLDVRSQAEFEAGPSIPGAVNIPLDQLSDAVRLGQLDDFILSSVAVVCASGQRSAQATVRLSKVFAFQSVVNVAGGMAAWQHMRDSFSSSSGGGGCGCGSSGGGGCSK